MSTYKEMLLGAKLENVIFGAIVTGLEEHGDERKSGKKRKTDKNYKSRQRSVFVNDAVCEAIDALKDPNITAKEANSGPHKYIKVHLLDRNIVVLFVNLSGEKDIPNKADYRGEFARCNIQRLQAMNLNESDDDTQLSLNLQTSLVLRTENPTDLPFGLIVTYNGGIRDTIRIRQGALQPNQKDWIFNYEITAMIEQKEQKQEKQMNVPAMPIIDIDKNLQPEDTLMAPPLVLKPSALSDAKPEELKKDGSK